jgi:hypothetical protein
MPAGKPSEDTPALLDHCRPSSTLGALLTGASLVVGASATGFDVAIEIDAEALAKAAP